MKMYINGEWVDRAETIPVMNPFDLAQLEGIDGEADIPIPREPATVMLVMDLIAKALAALFHPAVSTNVENRRQRFFDVLWHIEIRRDIEVGA